jgi:hypothetical protein
MGLCNSVIVPVHDLQEKNFHVGSMEYNSKIAPIGANAPNVTINTRTLERKV